MTESIFDKITGAIDERGQIKKGFSLGTNVIDGVRFVDGALDGIYLYHMNKTRKEPGRLAEIIEQASSGSVEVAVKNAEKYFGGNEGFRMLPMAPTITQWIANNAFDRDAENIYTLANYICVNSNNVEDIKFALVIFSMIGASHPDEDHIRLIKAFSMADELSFFGGYAMKSWPDAEDAIFETVKKVRGWGRIHLVELLNARREDVKEWLLFNGTDNDIDGRYSALVVAKKCDIENLILKKDLQRREYSAILIITSLLVDEGPVQGISSMVAGKKLVENVLERASEFELDSDESMLIKVLEKYNGNN